MRSRRLNRPRSRSRGVAGGRRVRWPILPVLLLAVAGCSLDSLLKSEELPPDVTDPAITQTPQGAVAAYHGTLGKFRKAFGGGQGSFALMTGLLGDELQGRGPVDLRLITTGSGSDPVYNQLSRVRGQAGQAIGLLTRYAPEHRALVGHAYTLEAYAEVFLAELFCSGIPLSTLDFDGDFTYRPGSSTVQVLTHARALFDTALTYAEGSARILHLAQVGQARALLGLGEYTAAAAVVAGVPDGYRYEVSFTDAAGADAQNFAYISPGSVAGPITFFPTWDYTVADREGLNGLDYRTSGDPRTRVTARTGGNLRTDGAPSFQFTFYYPDKYDTTGASPMVVASGVEARLIEAEAALHAGDVATWRAKLNALRTDGTQDGSGAYNPGAGGVAGLAPLADPTDPRARVDLLFRERAFWLFLTGQRQGDLRRLIRQYGRTQDQVYPTGPYSLTAIGEMYGSDVTAPIPEAERTANPLFTGCISREA